LLVGPSAINVQKMYDDNVLLTSYLSGFLECVTNGAELPTPPGTNPKMERLISSVYTIGLNIHEKKTDTENSEVLEAFFGQKAKIDDLGLAETLVSVLLCINYICDIDQIGLYIQYPISQNHNTPHDIRLLRKTKFGEFREKFGKKFYRAAFFVSLVILMAFTITITILTIRNISITSSIYHGSQTIVQANGTDITVSVPPEVVKIINDTKDFVSRLHQTKYIFLAITVLSVLNTIFGITYMALKIHKWRMKAKNENIEDQSVTSEEKYLESAQISVILTKTTYWLTVITSLAIFGLVLYLFIKLQIIKEIQMLMNI